eukprot:TRINITY_DN4242_c0_g1_i2.p1 TRINITY_DN4242_c0_g1~~TRINITY_DN4242_c0_g1_i2.p1  ORF type:complete len:409 (-),score=125.55 TRINITY_DN4242_c0_g1_i2:699-1925(-)
MIRSAKRPVCHAFPHQVRCAVCCYRSASDHMALSHAFCRLCCVACSCGVCDGPDCAANGAANECCYKQMLETAPICTRGGESPCIPYAASSLKAADKSFDITLLPIGKTPAKYHKYFEKAKKRWEEIVVGDMIGYTAKEAPDSGWFGGYFGKGSDFHGAVDDIVIGYKIRAIDGKNKVVGNSEIIKERAGRAAHKARQQQTPISAVMEFDSADVDDLIKTGYFQTVVLHEMGHALGIGYAWPTPRARCGGTCTAYQEGANWDCVAELKFRHLVTSRPDLKIDITGGLQLENTGASKADGTACEHWSETQLGDEIMTAYISSTDDPISIVSIGALEDLGYKVNYKAADTMKKKHLPQFSSRRSLRGGDNAQPTRLHMASLPRRMVPEGVLKLEDRGAIIDDDEADDEED